MATRLSCLRFVIVVFPNHTFLLFWPRNVCTKDEKALPEKNIDVVSPPFRIPLIGQHQNK